MSQVHWPSFLRELQATEAAWNTTPVRYPRSDAVPWMPFPLGQYVTLLTEAMMVAPPGPVRLNVVEQPGQIRYLDVGCGPGTKIRLAEAMFGLKGYGIDIVSRFVSEAQAHGVTAMLKDAYDFPEKGAPASPEAFGYADFQIVSVNRPSTDQDALEQLVMERMASDSVLIAVNWRTDPGKAGWFTAYQEEGGFIMPAGASPPVLGVWVKP